MDWNDKREQAFAISPKHPLFNEMMDKWQKAQVDFAEKFARDYGIIYEDASIILYIRSRSWWTQKIEDRLITQAQAGIELPIKDILSGDYSS
jgi:hypothetical protein